MSIIVFVCIQLHALVTMYTCVYSCGFVICSSKLRGAALQSLFTLARNYDNGNWRDHVEEGVTLLLNCVEVMFSFHDVTVNSYITMTKSKYTYVITRDNYYCLSSINFVMV